MLVFQPRSELTWKHQVPSLPEPFGWRFGKEILGKILQNVAKKEDVEGGKAHHSHLYFNLYEDLKV